MRRLALCALVFLALGSATAFGREKIQCKTEKGRQLALDGAKAYNVGHYDDAIRFWEAAYLECDDPEVLFNLGQAANKAGHYEKARDWYKAWLRTAPDATPADRDLVRKKLDKVEEQIAAQKKLSETPPEGLRPRPGDPDDGDKSSKPAAEEPRPQPPTEVTPATPLEPPPDTATARVPAGEPLATTGSPGTDERPRWYADTWGWALASTGTAALLVGGWLLLDSRAIADDARDTADHQDAAALFDTADTRGTIGTITMIGGGALLITGVVHFALHARGHARYERPRDPVTAAIGPRGVAITWTF